MVLPRAVAGLHAPPQQGHGLSRFHGQRPRDRHRKVKPGCLQGAVVGVVKIVQYVDAAAKNRVLVHHTQFAVQAAPAVRHQQAQTTQTRRQRRIDPPPHTGFGHFLPPGGRQVSRTNAVHQHLDPDTAQCGPHQRLGH